MAAVLSLATLDELYGHIHKTLCEKNFLDPRQFAEVRLAG